MLTGNICFFLFLSIHELGLIRSTRCIGSGVCLFATVGVWVQCGNHTVIMETLHVFEVSEKFVVHEHWLELFRLEKTCTHVLRV